MFGNEAIVSQLRLMRYDVVSHNAQKEILLEVVTLWKMTGKRATKTTQACSSRCSASLQNHGGLLVGTTESFPVK